MHKLQSPKKGKRRAEKRREKKKKKETEIENIKSILFQRAEKHLLGFAKNDSRKQVRKAGQSHKPRNMFLLILGP